MACHLTPDFYNHDAKIQSALDTGPVFAVVRYGYVSRVFVDRTAAVEFADATDGATVREWDLAKYTEYRRGIFQGATW